MNQPVDVLKSTKKEKLFYAIGNIGNCSWLLTSSFLSMYYTDSVFLSAAFMGTMMLVCRIFDGVSDLIMGMIVDKTKTRFGKARPWLLFMMVPLNICVFLMFRVPGGFSDTGKNIYALVTYFLVTVVFYTVINIAYQALLPRFSLSVQDRNVTNVIRTAVDIIATIVFSMVVPIIIEANGGYSSQAGWSKVALIFCTVSVVSYLICFLGIREKIAVDEGSAATDNGKIKEGLKILLTSRYFYISAFTATTFAIVGGATGVNIYFARYILQNDALYSLMSVISFGPMMLALPFIPALFKKFGKRKTMAAGLLIAVIGGALNFIDPYSAPLYFATAFIRSFAGAPLTASLMTLPGDVVDYNHWKHGIRIEGLTTSANSIGTKVGTGLGSAILGWLLAFSGYDGSLAVQTESALNSIIFCAIGLPVLVMAIACVLILFWDMEKYQDKITEFMTEKQSNFKNTPASKE